jgi:hypothetical protein
MSPAQKLLRDLRAMPEEQAREEVRNYLKESPHILQSMMRKSQELNTYIVNLILKKGWEDGTFKEAR